MNTRRFEHRERMDAADADPAELEGALASLRMINKLAGYNRSVLRALDELMGPVQPGERVSVLDVATGSADLPAGLIERQRKRGVEVEAVGLEFQPATARIARQREGRQVRIVRGDARRLPFADESFDYATCAMFLHHLPTAEAVAVLREMGRVTRRGLVVADLLRRRRAMVWVAVLGLLVDPMTRHDARVSVQQAWTPEEARDLAERAGLRASYRETFGHRFLLLATKQGRNQP